MAEFDLMEFSRRFKGLLEVSGYDVNELCKRLNLSKATLYRYLKGEMAPKITTVEVLANIFEVSLPWLMGYDVPKNPSDKKIKIEKDLNQYVDIENALNEKIINPDIRLIARAGRKLSDEQAENIRKYAEYMYPEAFK